MPKVIASVVNAPDRLLDALRALHEKRATDDALNGLITSEGLTWRQVEVLRTLRNHLIQIRPNYNADTITGVLTRNSAAAAALYRLFDARFNPVIDGDRDQAIDQADRALRAALQQVGSLLDDPEGPAFKGWMEQWMKMQHWIGETQSFRQRLKRLMRLCVTARLMRSLAWLIACWPRLSTASDGGATGWMSPAMPTRPGRAWGAYRFRIRIAIG